jgi:hypothetical protein
MLVAAMLVMVVVRSDETLKLALTKALIVASSVVRCS